MSVSNQVSAKNPSVVALLIAAALLGGCAAKAATVKPTESNPTAIKPAAAPTSALRSFSEVIKEAKPTPGFFSLWRQEEKVWIEIKPEQFDQPFFLAVNVTQGVGERGLYGNMMNRSHVVAFKKIGNYVQLIARNTDFTA